MKKISKLFLSLFLVIAFVATLASCGNDAPKFKGTAKDLVNKLLLTDIDKGSFSSNFEVPASVTVDGYTAEVSWKSEDENHLTFTKGEEKVTGNVTQPAIGEDDAIVNFSANVTYNNETASKDFKIKVLALKDPAQKFKDFHQNPVKGENFTIEGYISVRGSLRNFGDGYATYLWVEDKEDYGGYYVYSVSFNDVAEYEKFVPGTHVSITGKVDVYNGSQIKSPKVTILEGTKEATVEDITPILPDLAIDANFEKLQTSNLVSATGLKVLEKKDFDLSVFNPQTLLVVERAGKKFNLTVDKYVYSDAYEKSEWNEAGKAIAAKTNDIQVGDFVTVKGLYGFNGFDAQICMLDITKDSSEPTLTDKEKAVAALTPVTELIGTSTFVENKTIDLLPSTDTVKYEYVLKDTSNTNIKLEGNKLVITLPNEGKVSNELTITAKVGNGTANVTVTIETQSLTAFERYVQAEKGTKFTDANFTGVVTNYNVVSGKDGKDDTIYVTVQCAQGAYYVRFYAKAAEAATKFKVGYNVTINTATKDVFNNLTQLKDVDLNSVVLGEQGTLPEYNDITSLISEGKDLMALQSTLVTLTGEFVREENKSMYFKIGTQEFAVRIDTKLGIAPTVKPEAGKTYTVKGILGWFNNPQLTPIGADSIVEVTAK